MFSNVIAKVTISRRSFAFGQSRAKVSAGFTNVGSLPFAAFDLCILLPVCPQDNNSTIQDYVHTDDQTQLTFKMTPGFKPFTVLLNYD